MKTDIKGDWLVDDSKTGELHYLRVTERLHNEKTAFQEAQLVETEAYGRALILDGSLQASAKDEYIYHESMVHPAMLAVAEPQRVAVLGGGEGATIREVLKHRAVEQVTMVDIDQQVVEFCRRYLPSFHRGSFDDPRLELVFDDARKWIGAQPASSLDVVVVDITEPLEEGPAYLLFTQEFYGMVRRALAPDGAMLVQAGPADPVGHLIFTRIYKTIEATFDRVRPMVSYIPSFGDQWGFVLGCTGAADIPPIERIDQMISKRISGELQNYDAETQRHIMSLPNYLRRSFPGTLQPFTDNDPPRMRPGVR